MKGIELFIYTVIKPFKSYGYTHPFFDVHLDTIIFTWLGMALLFAGIFIGRFFLKKKKLNLVTVALEGTIEFFYDLCVETLGFFKYEYFAFGTALFFFTLACNLVGLLPFCEESSKDLGAHI